MQIHDLVIVVLEHIYMVKSSSVAIFYVSVPNELHKHVPFL
jgi:hypothetical protein